MDFKKIIDWKIGEIKGKFPIFSQKNCIFATKKE